MGGRGAISVTAPTAGSATSAASFITSTPTSTTLITPLASSPLISTFITAISAASLGAPAITYCNGQRPMPGHPRLHFLRRRLQLHPVSLLAGGVCSPPAMLFIFTSYWCVPCVHRLHLAPRVRIQHIHRNLALLSATTAPPLNALAATAIATIAIATATIVTFTSSTSAATLTSATCSHLSASARIQPALR